MTGRNACTLAVALVLAGCAGPKVEYDPLHDKTSVDTSIHLAEALGYKAPGPFSISLSASLDGKGKRPKQWNTHLGLWLNGIPKARPPILAEYPTIEIGERKFRTYTSVEQESDGSRSEHFSVIGLHEYKTTFESVGERQITMDDLVALAEGARLRINGEEIPLSPEQRNQIRDVVIAARAATAE